MQSVADFRDDEIFPPFKDLPGLTLRPDSDFMDDNCQPIAHWCFMGEIEDLELFIRPVVTARDKRGETSIIAFYMDDRSAGEYSFQPNHTIAVLYPEQHHFRDGRRGIRVEDPKVVKVGSRKRDSSESIAWMLTWSCELDHTYLAE
ncbi:predicted protein [Uncinocarpus reesii 1704]|uniref:Uncharacterized protein n=1 Tax=Uncinocarpus reesii (strain UAMH 1704) TaxID=336963 RepID=C4JZG4_UNCRE|nr:uncharacterized protein UREG_07565 [Uncinocarpus reesii 1704]EEP82700.1 predicted protein [Uncinocarpus reesii 1704]